MDFKIGIEMREEYKRLETARGALKFMRDFMLVKPGENVVFNYDTCVDERVVRALAEATYSLDASPVVVYTPTGRGFYGKANPPAPLSAAVAAADVWVELSYAPIMHSEPYRQAVDVNGARYVCATGLDVEMLVNLIEKVNIDKVIELGEYFKKILEESEASIKGYPVMMPGQTSWCPIEETINGTLVFDGAVFPPEIGILQNKIMIDLENGRVKRVYGDGQEARIFYEWLKGLNDPNMLRLAHYSQGFNPGVTHCTGRIVEDERVFGCMEFGIGSQGKRIGGSYWDAVSHTDGILLRPSIYLNGSPLEENGVYTDPTARKLCAELGIEGY